MLFARNFHFKKRNASEKCVLRYLVPKHIACNDVISSNWHYSVPFSLVTYATHCLAWLSYGLWEKIVAEAMSGWMRKH